MSLSTILLICAVVAGLGGGLAARFRSWGTGLGDLLLGLLTGTLVIVFSTVVLTITHGLNLFGVIHILYLTAVIGLPIAFAIIAGPHLLNAEFVTPFIARAMVPTAIVLVGVGIWGTHIEPGRLRIDEHGLAAPGASTAFVVGVIADLQTPSIGQHENDALDDVLAAEPDLVVLPGDLFQFGDPRDFDAVAPEFVGWLRRLDAGTGEVIIVNGDVDDLEQLAALAETAGVTFLDNSITTIEVAGQAVSVIGLTTPLSGDRSVIDPIIVEQIDATVRDRDVVIMVSHRPDVVLSFDPDWPIDLLIAGHTHGGQVSVPGFGPPILFSEVPREVGAGGLHLVNGHPIYVSTGVGLERGQAPQLRFGVRPSVGLLTLVPE